LDECRHSSIRTLNRTDGKKVHESQHGHLAIQSVDAIDKVAHIPELSQNEQIPPPVHREETLFTNSSPAINHSLGEAEQHNYVGENSVHFHRQEPANINLEFRRPLVQRVDIIQSDNAALGPNLRPNRLRSKINKKTLSTKEAEKGAEREEEVVDYRHDQQPNKNEDDYKQMP